MSELEARVGSLERGQAEHGVKLDAHGRELGEIKSSVRCVADGVDKLLLQNASKPQAASWRDRLAMILGTMSIIGGLYAFVTWLVGDVTHDMHTDVKRNSKFVDTWQDGGRLLFLEDRVKRMQQLQKPSGWPTDTSRSGGS